MRPAVAGAALGATGTDLGTTAAALGATTAGFGAGAGAGFGAGFGAGTGAAITTGAGVTIPVQLDTLTCEDKIDDTSTSTAFTVTRGPGSMVRLGCTRLRCAS